MLQIIMIIIALTRLVQVGATSSTIIYISTDTISGRGYPDRPATSKEVLTICLTTAMILFGIVRLSIKKMYNVSLVKLLV